MKRTRRTTQTVTVVTENRNPNTTVTIAELDSVLTKIPDVYSMRVEDALVLRDRLNNIFGAQR